MPPKKQAGKKKVGAKEKKKLEEALKITHLLKILRRNYESNCCLDQSYCHVELRNHLKNCSEEGKHVAKWILTESPPEQELKVRLLPLLAALRSVRYLFIKELYVWDIQVRYQDLLALSQFFQQPSYSLSYLELVECKIDKYSLERFSECLSTNTSLSALVLDYNRFGDEGCLNLCAGLQGNKTLTRLSLNFCDLTFASGLWLGKTICETAISELYLDGNKLECEGLIELIKMVADKSEQEAIERRDKKEAEKMLDESGGKGGLLGVKTGMSAMRAGSAVSLSGKSPLSAKSAVSTTTVKKKKRKKSAKKKAPPAPPKVGPWLTKLHVNDNGIDSHGVASSYAPVLCMRLVKNWISTAADMKELDIDDNLIGDLGGREIMDGLQIRKDAGLSNATVWITHRMHSDTFNKILTLGSGGGKSGKKKKKGKPGKKRI